MQKANDGAPVVLKETAPYPFYRPVTLGAMELYQTFISPARGRSCPMHPHCSRYCVEAFDNCNPLQAYVMTTDRLLRCGHDLQRYGRVAIQGQLRFTDPVGGGNGFGQVLGRRTLAASWQVRSVAEGDSASVTDRPFSPAADEESLLLEFARTLHHARDYGRAITEYLRYISYYPASPDRSLAEQSLVQCYYEAGLFDKAMAYGEALLQDSSHPPADDISFCLGSAGFRSSQFDVAHSYLGALADRLGPLHEKAQMVGALTYAYEFKWQEAQHSFEKVGPESEYAMKARTCARLSRDALNLKYKNPRLAGVAAIVPGLGYLYAGYPTTALSALMVNGLFFWGTYEAFDNDLPGLGATLAVFGIGWYAGNIYGSVTSSHRRNAEIRQDYLTEFEIGFEF